MKFIKFLPWLWNYLDPVDRCVILFLSFIAVSTLMIYIFGKAAVLPILVVFVISISLGVASIIVSYLRQCWNRYTTEQEIEADTVLAKLKGDRQN